MYAKRRIQVIANKIAPKLYNYWMFFVKNGYLGNFKNPKTFNEKVQWRKYYEKDTRIPQLVDKFEVKKYIANINPSIVVKTLGIYNNIDEINYSNLPNQFILKPTHGFGKVLMCTDKKSFDIENAKKVMREWFEYNQYDITGEWQYKNLKPRIICEELLGENIKDYKFFCFDGEPTIIQIDSDRYIDHKRQLRDTKWQRIKATLAYPNDEAELPRPKELDQMIDICRTLSAGFSFVRVDLYLVEGHIYFSELTFTPGNGMDRFNPKSFDIYLGEKWIIN